MYVAALFIIAKRWKQPKRPSSDEWMNKLQYIHTMEYYSAIKRSPDMYYIMNEARKHGAK